MSITSASEKIRLICVICVRKIKETDLSEKFTELIYWLIYFPNIQFAVVEFSFWKQKSPYKSDDSQGAIYIALYPERKHPE